MSLSSSPGGGSNHSGHSSRSGGNSRHLSRRQSSQMSKISTNAVPLTFTFNSQSKIHQLQNTMKENAENGNKTPRSKNKRSKNREELMRFRQAVKESTNLSDSSENDVLKNENEDNLEDLDAVRRTETETRNVASESRRPSRNVHKRSTQDLARFKQSVANAKLSMKSHSGEYEYTEDIPEEAVKSNNNVVDDDDARSVVSAVSKASSSGKRETTTVLQTRATTLLRERRLQPRPSNGLPYVSTMDRNRAMEAKRKMMMMSPDLSDSIRKNNAKVTTSFANAANNAEKVNSSSSLWRLRRGSNQVASNDPVFNLSLSSSGEPQFSNATLTKEFRKLKEKKKHDSAAKKREYLEYRKKMKAQMTSKQNPNMFISPRGDGRSSMVSIPNVMSPSKMLARSPSGATAGTVVSMVEQELDAISTVSGEESPEELNEQEVSDLLAATIGNEKALSSERLKMSKKKLAATLTRTAPDNQHSSGTMDGHSRMNGPSSKIKLTLPNRQKLSAAVASANDGNKSGSEQSIRRKKSNRVNILEPLDNEEKDIDHDMNLSVNMSARHRFVFGNTTMISASSGETWDRAEMDHEDLEIVQSSTRKVKKNSMRPMLKALSHLVAKPKTKLKRHSKVKNGTSDSVDF